MAPGFAPAPLGRRCPVAPAVSFPPPLRHRRRVSGAPVPLRFPCPSATAVVFISPLLPSAAAALLPPPSLFLRPSATAVALLVPLLPSAAACAVPLARSVVSPLGLSFLTSTGWPRNVEKVGAATIPAASASQPPTGAQQCPRPPSPGIGGAAAPLAVSVICAPPGIVELSAVSSTSDAGTLVHAFGRCMGHVTEAFTSIHNFVKWLRDKTIRLDTDELMNQARIVLEDGHKKAGLTAKRENIDKYARALRSLLSCETLPDTFSVTNGVQVPTYGFGDCVDGLFIISGQRSWSYGVVVEA
jgi:hypothetical protein